MNRRMRRTLLIVAGVVVVLAVAVIPIVAMAQGSATNDAPKPRVVVLPPSLVFEKLQDESPLDAAKFGGPELAKQLMEAGEQNLRNKGLGILASTDYLPQTADSVGKLIPMTGRIARGSLTEASRAAMADLAGSGQGPTLLFAQFLRIRVGSKNGYWNPINGAIGSGQLETVLAAALVDPANGTIVWKNEVLVRKILAPGSRDLTEALSALYAAPSQ
jgi:hypothetical protein